MKDYYSSILNLLAKCSSMSELKQLHGLMITTSLIKNVVPLSKLIDYLTKHEPGKLNYAESLFNQIDQPSVYIWNSMIRGYAISRNPNRALEMLKQMHLKGYSPDHFTFPFILKACSIISDHNYGTCVHTRVVKTGFEVDWYASTALLHMYVSCGDIEAGLKVFDKIPKCNVVAWTCLIAGYVNNNKANEAIRAFKDMEFCGVKHNELTMVNVLSACARIKDIDTGKWVHDLIHKNGFDPFDAKLKRDFNVILATSILDMYGKCGRLVTARALFDRMPERNLVAWNSMISAYNQYRYGNEILQLFFEMQVDGFGPDEATYLSALGACAHMGALDMGRSLHAQTVKTNIYKDISAGTSLMDMYAKSGDFKGAKLVFHDLQKKDVMAWTSMIIGLAIHGYGEEALSMFKKMLEDTNLIPDQITYIGVLCACSHKGLVAEGYEHFNSMSKFYGIVPLIEHYGCMVDLLSRAGQLREAERLVERMPVQPNIAIWGSLLNGCKIFEKFDLADRVAKHVIELELNGSGVYVLLSNIYANARKWEEVKRARELIKCKRVKRSLGYSSIEMKMLAL